MDSFIEIMADTKVATTVTEFEIILSVPCT